MACVKDCDSRVALKVGDVETQDAVNAVNHHDSYKVRIVGALAAGLVLRDEPLPLGQHVRSFIKERKKGF